MTRYFKHAFLFLTFFTFNEKVLYGQHNELSACYQLQDTYRILCTLEESLYNGKLQLSSVDKKNLLLDLKQLKKDLSIPASAYILWVPLLIPLALGAKLLLEIYNANKKVGKSFIFLLIGLAYTVQIEHEYQDKIASVQTKNKKDIDKINELISLIKSK